MEVILAAWCVTKSHSPSRYGWRLQVATPNTLAKYRRVLEAIQLYEAIEKRTGAVSTCQETTCEAKVMEAIGSLHNTPSCNDYKLLQWNIKIYNLGGCVSDGFVKFLQETICGLGVQQSLIMVGCDCPWLQEWTVDSELQDVCRNYHLRVEQPASGYRAVS